MQTRQATVFFIFMVVILPRIANASDSSFDYGVISATAGMARVGCNNTLRL
jgi:hypothetical protein